MRILHIISRLNYGGAAALVSQWLPYLRNSGYDVEVCVLYSKGYLADKLEEEGIVVHSLELDPEGKTYQPKGKYNFFALIPLAKLIRSGKYDIVHAHLFPTSLFISIISIFVKTVYIFSEHNVSNGRRRFQVLKLLDWLIYQRYTKIIAVSDEVEVSLLNWLPGIKTKVQVIHNSVNPKKFDEPLTKIDKLRKELEIPNECQIILYAGRLVPAKGPDILLDALEYLANEEIPLKVLIAGDGPLLKQLQQRATATLGDMATFLGLRNDVPTLLGVADLIVLPSRWEGLPVILLEAMAARRPVIATSVGGIPEVIKHGVNGWLVTPGNAALLAEGMRILLKSPELRHQLADRAYQTVCAQYSIDIAVRKIISVYEEVSRR